MASTNFLELLIPVIIVLFIVFRLFMRVWNNSKGVKYSIRSLFMLPVIYLILSAYFILGLGLIQSILVVAAILVGIFVGIKLGEKSEIFEKDGKILYKRSTEVLAIWMVGFVVRIGAEFLTNPLFTGSAGNYTNSSALLSSPAYKAYENGPVILGADILLAFSAGLLLGEAFVLYQNHTKNFKNKKA